MNAEMPDSFPCPLCAKKGQTGEMKVLVEGRYGCATCKSTIESSEGSILPRLFADLRKTAEENYLKVRDPPRLPTPPLKDQFEDAWLALLLGRYSASIIGLAVFMEALVRERIFLKKNIRYKEPLGRAVELCEKEKLLDLADLSYLRKFKDEIRNIWLHHDLDSIAGEMRIPAWKIEFPKGDPGAMLQAIDKLLKQTEAGEAPPEMIRARDDPVMMDAARMIAAQRIAFPLYESVWDFGVRFVARYLRQEDYDARKSSASRDR